MVDIDIVRGQIGFCSLCDYFSGVNIFLGAHFFRGGYFSAGYLTMPYRGLPPVVHLCAEYTLQRRKYPEKGGGDKASCLPIVHLCTTVSSAPVSKGKTP